MNVPNNPDRHRQIPTAGNFLLNGYSKGRASILYVGRADVFSQSTRSLLTTSLTPTSASVPYVLRVVGSPRSILLGVLRAVSSQIIESLIKLYSPTLPSKE